MCSAPGRSCPCVPSSASSCSALSSIGSGFSLGREGPTVQKCRRHRRGTGQGDSPPVARRQGANLGRRRRRDRCRLQHADCRDHICDGRGHRRSQSAARRCNRRGLGRGGGCRTRHARRPSFVDCPRLRSRPGEGTVFVCAPRPCWPGWASTVLVRGLLSLRAFVRSLAGLPIWARPAVGGAIMAAIGLALPQADFGIGYPTLSAALLGQLSWPRMGAAQRRQAGGDGDVLRVGAVGRHLCPVALHWRDARRVRRASRPSVRRAGRRHRRVLRAGRHRCVLRPERFARRLPRS